MSTDLSKDGQAEYSFQSLTRLRAGRFASLIRLYFMKPRIGPSSLFTQCRIFKISLGCLGLQRTEGGGIVRGAAVGQCRVIYLMKMGSIQMIIMYQNETNIQALFYAKHDSHARVLDPQTNSVHTR